MRAEDFDIECILDYMDRWYAEVDEALSECYPEMSEGDLTEEELEYIKDETVRCDNCRVPCRPGGLEFSMNFRGDLCYQCLQEYGYDDDEDNDE